MTLEKTHASTQKLALPLACIALLALTACGNDSTGATGDNGGSGSGNNNDTVPYTAGVFPAYKTLAAQCTTAAAQNNFLRSWINDTYLWYKEVPDLNPNSDSDVLDFFDKLKTPAITPSGADKDKFHFTYDTNDWNALSQSGVSAGYGAQWFLISASPPRDIRVAYVDPSTPASAQALKRGDSVVSVAV